uniref:RING-type E3 ubiquitin transferase n=1 Tax=Macrostomum lignano TaxID=282301 RepID=A0A1I8IRX0_9PLAT
MVYSVLFFCLFVRDAFRPGLFPAPEAEPNPLVRLVRMPWLATAFSTVACLAGFGCLSVLLLQAAAVAVPGFLPYRVTYSSESDLSFIEFLLWQVAFPAMLDQGHVKASLQSAVHRAPQPTPARLALFALSLAVCAVLGASVCLLCPVLIGRCLLRPFQLDSVNELYTAACGLYVCWALLSMGHLIADWLPWNRAQLLGLLRQWAQLLAKMLALGALYAAVAPLLLGVLFEKVVMIPLRLPDGCSPVLNLFHCWFTGLLLCKFITGCLFVGPNFRLKAALERLYEEGLARVPFVFIWRELYCPVLLFLGAPLAGPYLLLHGCLPLFVSDPRVLLEASRHLHFLATSTGAALALIGYEVRQFRRFYQHLVNDRYLVGQRLVNYHPD